MLTAPMFLSGDQELRPYLRGAVVGLIVFASTATTDLTTFTGSLDIGKALAFSLAELLTAAASVLSLGDLKKNSSLTTLSSR